MLRRRLPDGAGGDGGAVSEGFPICVVCGRRYDYRHMPTPVRACVCRGRHFACLACCTILGLEVSPYELFPTCPASDEVRVAAELLGGRPGEADARTAESLRAALETSEGGRLRAGHLHPKGRP